MTDESWYAETAYGVSEVPQQERSSERSWIMRFAKVRLPWGNAEDVTSVNLLEKFSSKKLRLYEGFKKEREEKIATETYSPSPFEDIDFHIRDDHERFRYALLPASSHFWMYMLGGGRFLFFLFFIITFFIFMAELLDTEKTLLNVISDYSATLFIFLGVPLGCWLVGTVVIKFFPQPLDKSLARPHLGTQPPYRPGHCLRLQKQR